MGARGVLAIMPADSMRPEAPKNGKRIWLERVQQIWKRISFSWKMVIRNVLRNKKRFFFLVFGLSMAYAINTVPLYMAQTIPLMFDKQYSEYQKMDFNVDFSRPMNESVIVEIGHLVNTTRIEPKLEFPFELKNNWYKKTVTIIGAPADTAFYKLVDLENNPVKLERNAIILTDQLAKTLHLQKGDRVKIRNFIPGKEDVTLSVGNIVQQYLGSNAYMDIATMQSLLVDRQMITGITAASKDDVKEKLKDVKHISAVRSIHDVKDSFMEYLDTMVVATNAYMLFGGILGFAIIYNSTIIGISERKMEFASLRVMGFDKRDVFRIVTRENMLMAVVAILFGIPLGIGMIQSMSQAFSSEMISLPAIYSPRIFIVAAIATAVFVVIAQLAARKKIYDMDFIEALKSRIS
jgi:putative ABC transport system permease protein